MAREVVIEPPTAKEIERVARALYAASHVNEGFHGRTISPWSQRAQVRGERGHQRTRELWESFAIAAIDMTNGTRARL